ncbi:MAG: hypothetical protein LBQ59_02455 [Candidatus Peribacteria bacterium]|nr:hypothetical protein [Candidatus Peribacteria bacterium]
MIVQVFIKTVATGQRLLSKCDSITVQIPFLSGFAFNSFISATSKIISSNSSIQNQVKAETGIIGTSPPQSSATNHCSASCHFTWSGFAHSLSILFIATIIGISASFA